MTVYELINELEKLPAGAEVGVSLLATYDVGIEEIESDYEAMTVTLRGGDAGVILDNGKSAPLSEVSKLPSVPQAKDDTGG